MSQVESAPRRGVKKMEKLTTTQKKQVRRMIARAHEDKFIDDYTNISAGVTSSGTVTQLGVPAQGTGVSQRVGDTIEVKRIELQYVLAGGDVYNNIRVIVFKWNVDSNLSAPTLASVLYTTNVTPVIAPYVWDNIKSKEVQIVYDRTHSLSYGCQLATVSSNGIETQHQKVNLFGKRLHARKVEVDQGGTTGYGIYYILFVSDSAITPNPTFGFNARIVYEDA